MTKIFKNLRTRWKAKTPRIFKWIIKIALSISGVSIAIHSALMTAGANEPEWWMGIYPYLVGVPAGMAAVAKITQTYDNNGNPILNDELKDEQE